eukprot:scaffold797_cov236-Pinguiococcus_pyrenoidosus.AAC.3
MDICGDLRCRSGFPGLFRRADEFAGHAHDTMLLHGSPRKPSRAPCLVGLEWFPSMNLRSVLLIFVVVDT